MKRKVILVSVLIVLFIGAVFGVEKYFNRTIVYQCTNNVTNLPVFIKIRTFGAFQLLTRGGSWVEVDYHHPDGEAYLYAGTDTDYFDDHVFAQGITMPSTIWLDLLTRDYSIHEISAYSNYGEPGADKRLIASGFCAKH